MLFAQKPKGLCRLLQSVKTHSESSGLYLNAKKTKIMDLDKSPTTTIDVDGEQLKNVNNFVYLGSRIDADGKASQVPTFDARLPSLFLNLRSAPSLNKRSEISGHCIHRKKFLLSSLSISTDEVSIADRNSES